MSLAEPNPSSANGLAASVHGRGAAMASVRDALDAAWKLAPEPQRERIRLQNEVQLDILTGAFQSAQHALDQWDAAIASLRDEEDHAVLAKFRLYSAIELGDKARAVHLAAEYLEKRDAWSAPTYTDWEILPLRVQYLAGGLSREMYQSHREAWFEKQAVRPQMVAARNYQWVFAYALAVATPNDAIEALQVLPKYLPFVDALTRNVELDGGIGFTYLLAGDLESAQTFLRRGATSCAATILPFEHTWANLHLGMALEQTGDLAGACKAYSTVLTRWGKEHRSVSANTARARLISLHCAKAYP